MCKKRRILESEIRRIIGSYKERGVTRQILRITI